MKKILVFCLVLTGLFTCKIKCSDIIYGDEASTSALNAKSVFYAVSSLAILLEFYKTWRDARDAQGDSYVVSQYGEKYYAYTSGAHELLVRALRGEPLQVHNEPRAACICVEGMPGNGGSELARNVASIYQAHCVEVDVRALAASDSSSVEQFFQRLARNIAVNEGRTVLIFSDYDLVSDCLYAQKSMGNVGARHNIINQHIVHVLTQPKATCFFLVRNIARLDCFFTNVISPCMIRLGCPNMEARARLMNFYCSRHCNNELRNIASPDCVDRIVYHSRGFTVHNIASMCVRVAEQKGLGPITDRMWNKAYYEELSLCPKEHHALDDECKIDSWDRLQALCHQLNDLAYRLSYACGLSNLQVTI